MTRIVGAVVGGVFFVGCGFVVVVTVLFFGGDSASLTGVAAGAAAPAALTGDLASLAGRLGVPERALVGTVLADRVSLARVGCRAPWWLLLSVSVEESGAGTHGGAHIDDDWVVRPHIGGPSLAPGSGFEVIGSEFGGYDSAQGPFQFIGSSWLAMGEDYDSDGVADPHNFLDAALGAANHLCLSAGGRGADLTVEPSAKRGLFGYNRDASYGSSVWQRAQDYLAQGGDQPTTGQAAQAAPPGSPSGQLVELSADVCSRSAGCRLDASWAPALTAALRGASAAAGRQVTAFSAYRSYEEQAAIYSRNCPTPDCPGGLTASPGTSSHEGGQAADVDVDGPGDPAWEWLVANGSALGVNQCRCITGRDPVHFSASGR